MEINKLIQVVDMFELISYQHPEINGFCYGPRPYLPENIKLPALQLNIIGSNKIKAYNTNYSYPAMEFYCELRVIDRHNQLNQIDVENSTHQILDNIVNLIETDNFFKLANIELTTQNVVFSKDYETTTHNTIGWVTTLDILVKNWNCTDGLPISMSGITDGYIAHPIPDPAIDPLDIIPTNPI